MDLGLKFIPTPRSIPSHHLSQTFDRIIRNIKLTDFFFHNPSSGERSREPFNRMFQHPSTFTPTNNQLSTETATAITNIKRLNRTLFNNQYNNITTLQSRFPNLSKEHQHALQTLKNNHTITIKPADKGGAVVIMDTQLYIQEAHRQLHNTKYYLPITEPKTPNIIPSINKILAELYTLQYINSKQLRFLQPQNNDTVRQFYILPKIHKSKDSWPNPDMPPGRPIVSDTNSPTYQISRYIDYYLRPLACLHKSYIKDTYDFVQKIRNQVIPAHALLVTADVTSLYTNMHHDRIIETITEQFNNHPDPKRPDKQLIQLLTLLLKTNDFSFNNNMYLQVTGAAMGYPTSPSCADIYLEKLDNDICNTFANYIPFYFRFLDDINFAWLGSIEQLDQLTQFANNLIPGIEITLTVRHHCISFLDTIVYKSLTYDSNNNTTLHTKVYFKPTDTHQLLHTHSHHPPHTANGVIKSQLIRFKRLSTNFLQYNASCNILWSSLKHRGYSSSKFRKLKREIYNRQVNTSKKKKTNTQNNPDYSIFPIVTYYDHHSQKLNKYIRTQLKNVDAFKNMKMLSAYKNHKSIKNMIISSKVKHPHVDNTVPQNAQIRTCNHPRCACCKHLDTNISYHNSTGTITRQVSRSFDCNSSNIIYLIKCKTCNKQYVGMTERKLKERLNNHRSDITLKKSTPIAIHFNLHGLTNLIVKPIFQISPNCTYSNKLRTESAFIQRLQTQHPQGINYYPIDTQYNPNPNP